MRKLFIKSVSLLIIAGFSYSQFAWAEDPRQMLLDAKKAFDEMVGSPRPSTGTSASQLTASQTTAQNVVTQQNALQDLQNLNFNLTTQNGDILTYVGNTLNQAKRPDGTTLINILTDASGNISSADLRLSDGSVQVYQNGQVIGTQTPDGSQVIYSGGQIQKVISKDGTQTLYSYVKDTGGHVIQTILDSPATQAKYDANGKLTQVLQKTTGNTTYYTNGVLNKITLTGGGELRFSGSASGSDLVVALSQYVDSLGNKLQFQNGAVSGVTLADNTLLTNLSWNADNTIKTFKYTDSLNNQVSYDSSAGYQIKMSDGLALNNIVWNADNSLKQATWLDASNNQYFYDSGNVYQITLSGGNRYQNIAWGSDQKIKDAGLILTDGSKYSYQNKKLVQSWNAQGLSTTYTYTADRVIAASGGVTYEYLLDKTPVKTTWADGSTTLYLQSGVYKGLRDKDVTATSAFIYEYQTVSGVVTVQKREAVNSVYNMTTLQGDASISSSNNPFSKFTVFFANDNSPDPAVTATATGNGKTLMVSLACGSGSTYTFSGSAAAPLGVTLQKGVLYNVEIRWQLNGIGIYVYAASTMRPASPQALVTNKSWNPQFKIQATNVDTQLDATSSGTYTRTTTVSDKNNAYQPSSPVEKVAFRFNSNLSTNTIVLNADQQKTGNITRKLAFTYLSGKWTVTKADTDSTTNKTTNTTVTANQALTSGIDTVAELRIEGGKANLYVYASGTARPSTPAASIDAFDTATKLYASNLKNANSSGQILKNLSTPALSTAQSQSLTAQFDTAQNSTFTRKTLSVSPKKNTPTQKPSQSFLDGLIAFQTLTYDSNSSLKEILKKDNGKLNFENGLLKQALDASGNITNFSFTQSALSNILGSQIVQNGLTSSYDPEGKLSAVSLNGLTVHYKSGAAGIDFIEKEDGTEIHGPVFSANGQITGALVVTPDGEERTYAAGKLVSLKKSDASQIFYANDKPLKIVTSQKLTYNFNYTPTVIEAVLDTTGIPTPDALTPVKMQYDASFNLKTVIRQNQESLNYLNNDLTQISLPGGQNQVFNYTKNAQGNILSYTVTQGNTTTYYDVNNNPLKAIISASSDNPHTLEVTYQYGKIRQITKDTVLTFVYSYSFNAQNEEITTIDDKQEKSLKTYKNSFLLNSITTDTSVLATYSYDASGKVAKVDVTRFGRLLHTYNYSYPTDQTVVTDEEGTVRTYDAQKRLVLFEKDGKTFSYSYQKQQVETGDFVPAGDPFSITATDTSARSTQSGSPSASGWTSWRPDHLFTYWGGQWIEYTVNPAQTGDLEVDFETKNIGSLPPPPGYEGFQLEFIVDGTSREVFTAPADPNNWQPSKTLLHHLTPGTHTIRIQWLNDAFVSNQYDANLELQHLKFTPMKPVMKEETITKEERLLANPATLDPDTVISSEYASDGTLETQTKADGTVTLFDSNKPFEVLDTNGVILIQYTYDASGNIQRVYLKNARDTLPAEVLKAKAEIEKQRVAQLEALAQQKNLSIQSIKSQLDSQRQQLESQLVDLQNQFNNVAGTKVSGKKAKSQRGDVLNQIGHAMDDVRGALANLESQQADAYAALDAQVKQVSDQIEADAQKSYTVLSNQETALKKEILKQEVSPVVYDTYRRTLGRDPSSQEYDTWTSRVDYDSDGGLLTTPMRFNGLNDFVGIPKSDDFSFGLGAFTIDFWVNFKDLSGEQDFFGQIEDANNWFYATAHTNGQGSNIVFQKDGARLAEYGYNTHFLANTWYHIAYVRPPSGDIQMYVNGIRQTGSNVPSAAAKTLPNYAARLAIGTREAGGPYINGYLDEFRVSKGIARWTDNFTPSSAPYKADANTVLLLEPANTGKWVDGSFQSHPVNMFGSPVLDNTQKHFDSQNSNINLPANPVHFDGNGDYLNVPDSGDFDFSSGIWTVDFWIYPTLMNTNHLLWGQFTDGNNYMVCYLNSAGSIVFTAVSGGVIALNPQTTGPAVVLNTWQHIAIVENGNSYQVFVNGNDQTSSGGTNTNRPANYTNDFSIAGPTPPISFGYFNGYVDEFRVSNGVARWTSHFTPLRAPYIPDQNTSLLLETDSRNYLIDQSASHHVVSSSGNVFVDTGWPHFPGKIFQETLSESLNASPEFQERNAYVSTVKQNVTGQVNSFLAMSDSQKQVFAQTLGLAPNEIINLTASDAQKILTWLNSRGLHFGQSAFLALESLLDQKGIVYTRTDLAQKVILVDILTGVMTPLDDGDPVLSVFALKKVASTYGLSLDGAKISFDDILSLYTNNPQSQVVTLVNSSHFVVITAVTATTVTYLDTGAGKDKQNQSFTISKSDFLKIWQGNVLLENQKIQSQNLTSKVLSADQQKSLRGACWFIIVAVFYAVANIGSAVWAVANAIGTIIAAVGTAVGNALFTIGQALSTLGQGLSYIGQSLFEGIKLAASTVLNAGQQLFGSFLQQSVVGGGTQASFSNALFQTVVKTGINIAVTKGLEALGVNSTIASFVGTFVTGGVLGGSNAAAGLGTGNFFVDGLKAVSLANSQTLLQQVGGANSPLSQALSLIVSPLVNGIQQGDIGGALVKIIPSLGLSFAQYGIDKLGASLGLPQGISSIIGSSIFNTLGVALQGGVNVGRNIINSINQGFTQGIVSYGLNFIGNSSPILGSLLSPDVAANIEQAIGQNGLFQSVFNIISRAVPTAFNVIGGVVNNIGAGLSSFGTLIQQQGLIGALSSMATSIFGRSTLETVVGQGGFQGVMGSTKTPITLFNGQQALELKLDGNNSLIFDNVSHLIGMKDQGIYELGDFGYDSFGNFSLDNGQAYSQLGNGLDLTSLVIDGKVFNIKIDGPSGELLSIDPEKAGQSIYIEGPKQSQPASGSTATTPPSSSGFDFWGAVFNLAQLGLSLSIGQGVAYAGQMSGGGLTSQPTSNNSTTLYALVNGIFNTELDPLKSPSYINNFESDIAKSSNGKYVAGRDFMKSAIYQGFGIPGLDQAKDIINLTLEAMSPIVHLASTLKIMMDFDSRLNSVPSDKSRPIVAMGYSGGFLPLVEAIQQRHYNTDTLIGLGAATTAPLNVPFDDISKILNYILLGQMSDAVNTLAKYLTGIKDISQLGIKRAVNVWGTNDILYQMGIAGKRDSIGGIKTYNIEIAGVTHFDYMRRSDEKDPVKADFNKRVSQFVVGLTEVANDDQKLLAFLQNKIGTPDSDGVWRFKP